MVTGLLRKAAVPALALAGACAGAPSRVDVPRQDPPHARDAGAPEVGPDAPPAPVERPFAATPADAQRMIQSEIDAHITKLWKCVEDYRSTAGAAHQAIVVDIGIDQEGHLLGVASVDHKHPLASTIKECMMQVLKTAVFPRSHSGVIAVRQTFQDAAFYQ